MNFRSVYRAWPIAIIFLLSCTHPGAQKNYNSQTSNHSGSTNRKLAAADAASNDWILKLPGAENASQHMPALTKRIAGYMGKPQTDPTVINYAMRVARYTAFVLQGCSPQAGPGIKNCLQNTMPAKLWPRLFNSSTQFILCPDLNDLSCLERVPAIPIQADFRFEDAASQLGVPKNLNATLADTIEWSFTTQILKKPKDVDFNATLARRLQDKIETDGKTAIYTALYGIDDVDKSMKGVYDALISKINAGVKVEAVFDQEMNDKRKSKVRAPLLPFVFTYHRPPADVDRWILAPFTTAKQMKNAQTVLPFQYDEGTQGLIFALSKDARNEDEAHGRIEWPDRGIMHNKFFVLQNESKYSVWTGTANVSETCMGTERNSNMGLYIKNNDIAQAFLDEFKEMYNLTMIAPSDNGKASAETEQADDEAESNEDEEQEEDTVADVADSKFAPNSDVAPGSENVAQAKKKSEQVTLDPKYPFRHGRFKKDKTPNTHRYFVLNENTRPSNDDTDFRVYFSPTDDAEHRAILPMLHSAQSGDIVRISMFGAAGIEYVRAMQLAASRGAKVEVIVDSPTASGQGSWATHKPADATLLENNPFGNVPKIALRSNAKKWKQNHQKVGLLLRLQGNGKHLAEHIIVGSQNWSASGNDINDENLVSIRNQSKSLDVGEAFNDHFTKFLWENATIVQ
jgi:phosphatidylserine/phosphatidylglycerophosphate/cardiolipin synthase-like enzyme